MKKIVLLALMLVLLVSFTHARELKQHLIEINITEEGNGKVIERYLLDFADENELTDFRNAAEANGASLLKWGAFDSSFASSIGTEAEIKNAVVSFEELGDTKFVRVSYSLNNISTQTSENSRAIEWKLNENIFSKFIAQGAYVFPDKTITTIGLPPTATIIGQIVPQAINASNRWNWNGYLISNQLILNYKINKPIAQPIDAVGFLKELFKNQITIILAIILVLMIVLGYFKRKELSEKIEDYIVKRSKIEPTEEQEEVNIE